MVGRIAIPTILRKVGRGTFAQPGANTLVKELGAPCSGATRSGCMRSANDPHVKALKLLGHVPRDYSGWSRCLDATV